MDEKKFADIAMVIVLVLALIISVAVAMLVLTAIFSWVGNVIEDGSYYISSVSMVFSALIVAAGLIIRGRK